MSIVAKPQDWLTDNGLTKNGEQARLSYGKFVNHLYSLGVPDFKVTRAMHLLQSNSYDTLPDGYALPPHTINFSLNNRCNLKCSYCDLNREKEHWEDKNTKASYSVIDPNRKYELPLETCKRIIDQTEWFRPVIRAHWMEPLLYSDLLPFLEYATAKKLPTSMLTNGLLLTKFAAPLAELGVGALRVSLDGPAEIHDSLCNVKGAYDKILEGLKMLVAESRSRGRDMQIGAYFTVTDKNCDKMLEVIEDLERHGLLEHMFVGFHMFNFISKDMVTRHNLEHASICGTPVEETSSQYIDVSKIDPATLIAQRNEIEKRFVEKGRRIHFRPNFTEHNLDFCLSLKSRDLPSVRCETHWHSVCINPLGHVKPMSQCILEPCGNIEEQNFMDVWNGPALRQQRMSLQRYGAYHGCMRCWSIYSNIEDAQGSWTDPKLHAA
jgi:MoaA/NifB/PqqE/SkfB family radical SAM enzyme